MIKTFQGVLRVRELQTVSKTVCPEIFIRLIGRRTEKQTNKPHLLEHILYLGEQPEKQEIARAVVAKEPSFTMAKSFLFWSVCIRNSSLQS